MHLGLTSALVQRTGFTTKNVQRSLCGLRCGCNLIPLQRGKDVVASAAATAAVVVAWRTFCAPLLFVPLRNPTGFIDQIYVFRSSNLCFVQKVVFRKD